MDNITATPKPERPIPQRNFAGGQDPPGMAFQKLQGASDRKQFGGENFLGGSLDIIGSGLPEILPLANELFSQAADELQPL